MQTGAVLSGLTGSTPTSVRAQLTGARAGEVLQHFLPEATVGNTQTMVQSTCVIVVQHLYCWFGDNASRTDGSGCMSTMFVYK